MEFNATFIVSVISFILFTLLMNRIFYAPISKVKDEREKIITDTLNEAEKSQQEADKINAERESKLSNAADESRGIIAKTVDKANNKSAKMTAEAKEKSIAEINEKTSMLMAEADEARKTLNSSAKDIAESITKKILG